MLEVQTVVEIIEFSEQYPSYDDEFSDQLENALKTVQQPTLKNSVPIRWNSLLVMINSFAKNINIINIALLNVSQEILIIPDMEKQIVKEFGKFLAIFEEATQYLQGQSYPTISCCISFYEIVINLLEKTAEESSFDVTIQLCNFAIENFWKRFKITKMHVVAGLMDPCQKNWPVL